MPPCIRYMPLEEQPSSIVDGKGIATLNTTETLKINK